MLYADPRDSSREVYYRDPIAVRFNRPPVGPVNMTLRDSADVIIKATVEVDGEWATLTPTRPLAPLTSYYLAVEWGCDGSEVTSFTTSAAGAQVSPELSAGRVFALDLSAGEPTGAGTFVLQVGGPPVHLLSVDGLGEQGTWAATPAWGTLPEPCRETEVWTGGARDNPWFELHGQVAMPPGLGLEFSARVSAALHPDGGALEGLRVDGVLDIRGATPMLVEDLGLDPETGDLCAFISRSRPGVDCGPCADGSPTCLPVSFARVPAPWAEHLSGLGSRTADEIAADPACRSD
jgi:hypothetical protein